MKKHEVILDKIELLIQLVTNHFNTSGQLSPDDFEIESLMPKNIKKNNKNISTNSYLTNE